MQIKNDLAINFRLESLEEEPLKGEKREKSCNVTKCR